jgi:L-threonylcarbamoyladenylate synthase
VNAEPADSETRPLVLDATADRESAIARAAAAIRQGELVAMPTETVYGLAADALDPTAVGRIFAAKQRPANHPLIVHVSSLEEADRVAHVDDRARRLAAAFWPGPLTLVLPRRDVVPDAVTGGLDTVGVRIPAHPVAQALIAACGRPLAAPSANRYTRLSPTRAEHVVSQLGDDVCIVLDAGPTKVGIESTVLDLSTEEPVLLRPGGIDAERIEQHIGPLQRPGQAPAEDAPRKSPGMSDLHYAPRARLRGYARKGQDALAAQIADARSRGSKTGQLSLGETAGIADWLLAMPGDATGYARELYAALHEADRLGCDIVYVEVPPDTPAWEGVRDRLRRAGLFAKTQPD